jgi:glycosyltransferase involved in cell wall biosynthesis
MRVVHVSPVDTAGGAAKGAYGLHKALRAANVDSLMLVMRKYSNDPSVLSRPGGLNIAYQAMRDRLDRVPLRFYNWDQSGWWTVGWLPFNIRKAIDKLKPDIIQFHWAGRGVAPIDTLGHLNPYPLVWTLRDMWPLTGGCHYSGNCTRFLTGCGRCPQLGSRSDADITSWQWNRKLRAWRDVPVNIVAPSNWMADCAMKSPLMRGKQISMIPNGVDVSRFKPIERAAARAAWNLPMDSKVILFGAINSTSDPRKGFSYLAEALGQLAKAGWDKKAVAVVFGASTDKKIDVGLPLLNVGTLEDDVSLAMLYSAADVMVVPSIQENAGKTAIEAMSCGTPVVAFANTGQVDIVDHKVNGYLAEDLSSDDLARGIAWCLEAEEGATVLSLAARGKVLRCFDIRAIANQYIALYEQCIAQMQSETVAEGAARPGIRGSVRSEDAVSVTKSGGIL